jgi:alpha-glucosidase (family GH31 glycosyl hydrolase)
MRFCEILLIICSARFINAHVHHLSKQFDQQKLVNSNDPRQQIQNKVSYNLQDFNIAVDLATNEIVITNHQKILFQTITTTFLRFGNSSVKNPPIVNGNYQLEEEILWISTLQTIDKVELIKTQRQQQQTVRVHDEEQETLEITGKLFLDDLLEVEYLLSFTLSTESINQLSFVAKLDPSSASTGAGVGDFNRLYLSYQTNSEETFHGFGESFTNFNLKGRRIPILVSEQGVGRGLQPITDDLNNDTEGVGGHWYTTYAPKPLYLTNQNRSMLYDNSEVRLPPSSSSLTLPCSSFPQVMFIDLTDPLAVEVEVWSTELRGNVIYGTTMRDLLFEITLYTGRMIPPPEWTQLVCYFTLPPRSSSSFSSCVGCCCWVRRGHRLCLLYRGVNVFL